MTGIEKLREFYLALDDTGDEEYMGEVYGIQNEGFWYYINDYTDFTKTLLYSKMKEFGLNPDDRETLQEVEQIMADTLYD